MVSPLVTIPLPRATRTRQRPARTYAEAERKLDAFERLLHQLGIKVRSGSWLEDAFLRLPAYRAFNRGQEDGPRSVQEVLGVVGLLSLADQLLAASATSNFPALLGHVELLAEDANVLQSLPSPCGPADLAFELLIGASLATFTYALHLERPGGKATETHPDIKFRLRGKSWGIACKALHSVNPQTVFRNITKGARQVRETAGLDHGFVILSLKNVLPYSGIVAPDLDGRLLHCYTRLGEPTERIRSFSRDLLASVDATITPDDWVHAFTGGSLRPDGCAERGVCLPIVGAYAEVGFSFKNPSGVTSLGTAHAFAIHPLGRGAIGPEFEEVSVPLHCTLQGVAPDSNLRGPGLAGRRGSRRAATGGRKVRQRAVRRAQERSRT